MANWNCTIYNGRALREAIADNNFRHTAMCLHRCCRELYDKMSDEDKEYYQFDIEDMLEILKLYVLDPVFNDDDEECLNNYLQDFYDICDDVRAFVAL